MSKMICQICNKLFNNANHLKTHNISVKDYYNIYLKNENEGICKWCGKETDFISIGKGYKDTCGYSCAAHYRESTRTPENIKIANEKRTQTFLNTYGTDHPMKNKDVVKKQANTNIIRYGATCVFKRDSSIRPKLEQTMIERYNGVGWGSNKNFNSNMYNNACKSRMNNIYNIENELNCTSQAHLVQKYGQGFLLANILPKEAIININNSKLVKNEYIPVIEAYNNRYKFGHTLPEQKIVSAIKDIYSHEINTCTKKPIHPKELDIFLPDLQLGIEFNGTRWHSIELGTSKNYHLEKSLLCRDKNIRLIHIYEFEDIEQQIQLLQDLILGQDNYPKKDFNKNNLIENIPEPEIIYHDNGYTIYGAGKLYI